MKRHLWVTCLALTPTVGHAELLGVTCNFTRVCNNYLACETITYDMTVAQTQDGWVFRDDNGDRAAVRLPEMPGEGIPAFASHASYDSTALLTIYSGGPALLVEHFEEPGFVALNGSCEVIE